LTGLIVSSSIQPCSSSSSCFLLVNLIFLAEEELVCLHEIVYSVSNVSNCNSASSFLVAGKG
jgi:hypothetical protein